MKEAQELRNPTDMYYAQPLDDNLFEWHFTVRGPADTDFDGGIYHGRILLPVDYPMKPPSVILLTPNGRFQLNQKICLSISGYHPESWRPSWSIRTALLALIGFMPTQSAGALGALEYPPAERRRLAVLSQKWVCKECGLRMCDALASESTKENVNDAEEARELAQQIILSDSVAETDVKEKKNNSLIELNSSLMNGTTSNQEKERIHISNLTDKDEKVDEQAILSVAASTVPEMCNDSKLKRVDGVSSSCSTLSQSERRTSLTVTGMSPPMFSWHLVVIAILFGIFCALLYRRIVNTF